jgi:hypothetical protein
MQKTRQLIAIVTCRNHLYPTSDRIKTILETWYATWLQGYSSVIDIRFFVGQGPTCLSVPGLIELDAPDDYAGLPCKVRKICEFALKENYDFVQKTDDDCVINWPKFKVIESDYAGIPKPGNYCGGGAYWLSRRSMGLIAEHGIDDWAEDRGVGTLLAKHGIQLKDALYIQPGIGIASAYGCQCGLPACVEKSRRPVWEYFPDAAVITQLSPEQVRACHRFYENSSRPDHRP